MCIDKQQLEKAREEFRSGSGEWTTFRHLINKGLEEGTYWRQVCTVDKLSKDSENIKYSLPLSGDPSTPVWVLPGMGYVAQDYLCLDDDEIYARAFKVACTKTWRAEYDRVLDVFELAIQGFVKALKSYEEEAFWRTVIPAATKGLHGEGSAPVVKLCSSNPASRYFSRELLSGMKAAARRVLTHIIVSPEDMEDIRSWASPSEFVEYGFGGEVLGVEIIVTNSLGVSGKYNINCCSSEEGLRANKAECFNDYQIDNPNLICDNEVTRGETQVMGFCDTAKKDIRLGSSDLELGYAPGLRQQRVGFWGHKVMSACVLDQRSLVMGVVNRSCSVETTPSQNTVTIDANVLVDFIKVMVELLKNK